MKNCNPTISYMYRFIQYEFSMNYTHLKDTFESLSFFRKKFWLISYKKSGNTAHSYQLPCICRRTPPEKSKKSVHLTKLASEAFKDLSCTKRKKRLDPLQKLTIRSFFRRRGSVIRALFSFFGYFWLYWSWLCMIFFIFEDFWWKKIPFKNLESSLFETNLDFYLIKSTFSSTSFESARGSTRMPYGSKWSSIHKNYCVKGIFVGICRNSHAKHLDYGILLHKSTNSS